MGANTLILEESTWLGGMLTSAGVSAVDGNYRLPAGLWGEFKNRLSDYCYERGFTIYPGKVTTTDTFRLCALGAIDVEDIEEFFKVLREALIENNIRVPVQYR